MAMQTSAQKSEANSILVNGNLVKALRSALNKDSGKFDRLPSNREILDCVVPQTGKLLLANPHYSLLETGPDVSYKWFDSEIATQLQKQDSLVDKGRFVDACIIAYLQGEAGLKRYCTTSKTIRPRQLTDQERSRIAKYAPATGDAKDVDSKFEPMTSQTPLE